MIWAFKMFFKIIGKVLLYSFCIPFAIVCLPFYLPYYLIKERRNKKNGLMTIRRGRMPKYSPFMSGQDYEVYCTNQDRTTKCIVQSVLHMKGIIISQLLPAVGILERMLLGTAAKVGKYAFNASCIKARSEYQPFRKF